MPASISVEDHYTGGDDYSIVKFSLKWRMACTKGSAGKCEGFFSLDADVTVIHGYCHGRCGSVNVGRSRESVRFDHLTPAERGRIRQLPIEIDLYCPNRLKKKATIKLWIAFTKAGNVNLDKSKLG